MTKDNARQRHLEQFGEKFERVEDFIAATTSRKRPNTYLYRLAIHQYETARMCWFDGEDTESAEELLLAALATCDRYKGRRRQIRLLRIDLLEALAFIYNHLERFEDSEKTILSQLAAERALAAENAEAYATNTALTLWRLGNLYAYVHRDKEAEKAYLEALGTIEQRRRSDNEDIYRYSPATAQCHRSLGSLYLVRLNDPDAALRHYSEAVRISEELCENEHERYNHLRGLAESLRLLAELYERTGQKESAQPLVKRAKMLEAEIEMPLPFDMPAEGAES